MGLFTDKVAMGLKDKLKALSFFPEKMGRLDKALVLFVMSFMGLGTVLVFASLSWFVNELRLSLGKSHGVQAVHQVESNANSPADLGEEHSSNLDNENPHELSTVEHAEGQGGAHGDSAQIEIGGSDIPQSILSRQDGILSDGYDLIDPEIKQEKGLSGFLEQDLKVSVGYRTVDIMEIMSGATLGVAGSVNVYMDATFEVDSYEAQKEVEEKRTEIKSLVSGIVSRFPASELKTEEGKQELKVEVYKELNRVLLKGKITDVLITNFMVR